VIAKQEVQATVRIEAMKEIKSRPMGLQNLSKPAILPQLVTITNFYIGEATLVVVVQCPYKKHLVGGEDIVMAPITTVTIAEEHKTGVIIEGNFACLPGDIGKTFFDEAIPEIR
jgi:hypothetical protein